ncbi:DUF4142 domain-containing protein [Halopseudomonas sabulinigri]|uniref:DUF4142 domain-containing protein n=1 Tax=Halopseudomonas sabulinigri TaxID=472181 RepID=A0ABP9ZQX8_9GAMM
MKRPPILQTLRTPATALLLSAAIGCAHAADQADTQPMVGGGDRVEQSGPTGMPATTGSGGSADTQGTFSDSGAEMGIGVEQFFSDASAQNIAAIEAAELALEQGSEAVKTYAQQMHGAHRQNNRDLRELAATLQVETEDDPALSAQAEQLLLKLRDGDDFDQAYLDNQIVAHQQAIALYNRAAQIDNEQVVSFAKATLPTLQEHLEQAQKLAGRAPAQPQ